MLDGRMGAMFFRRPRLDPDVHAKLTEAHLDAFGRQPARILAAAEAVGGWCVLLADVLALQDQGEWRFTPWHRIEQGGWNDQNSELRWELVDGRRGNALFDEPGRIPEVFRERVQASIVVQKQIPIEGTREGGIVSARRNLADRDAPLEWRIRRGRGTAETPENMFVLEAALADLKTDWDI